MQTFMQIMERMTSSRQPSSSLPQPIANPHDTAIRQAKQLSEKSKLVRPTYVKIKLANSQDWARWKNNVHEYMTSLQMPDILCATYEIPTKKSPEYTIYDI